MYIYIYILILQSRAAACPDPASETFAERRTGAISQPEKSS